MILYNIKTNFKPIIKNLIFNKKNMEDIFQELQRKAILTLSVKEAKEAIELLNKIEVDYYK